MEILTKKHDIIANLFNSNKRISELLNKLRDYKPRFNGDYYITDKQLSEKLGISRRTLFELRSKRMISYIKLDGKIIYRESDVAKLLDAAYIEAWNYE